MTIIEIILGTLIAVGICGLLIFRSGVYPFKKETYSELKDFLKEKWKELKSGKI